MDALVQGVGQWLINQGAVGILALAAIGWGWLERLGRAEERKDRKEAEDKLEAAGERYSNALQLYNDKLTDQSEKWATILAERKGR